MRGPNLSAWALKNQTLILYFMLVLAVAGVMAYFNMGRAEDPGFTFRAMVVNAYWPGATAQEMQAQVTDRLEKKIQEVPGMDYIESFSKPGETYLILMLQDSVDPASVEDSWYQVRKKVADIKHQLPNEVVGPFFNDEFGTTYGSIYALTGDGFDLAELRRYAEWARAELLRVKDVEKVDLIGVQSEKIFIELSDAKLSTFGLDPTLLLSTLQQQNVMGSAGDVVTQSDRVFVRVSGDFNDVASVKNIGIRANNRIFRLGDVANVWRGYADPPGVRMHYAGTPSIGIAISMKPGGNILSLGKRLQSSWQKIEQDLPIGIDVHQVSDQPKVVKNSVDEFLRTLVEALAIVLFVSFLSLGWRSGTVVALCIPLVLAAVFAVMNAMNMAFEKISLGALIIALGLLVDDAMIAVEMMLLKLEQGYDKIHAATFAYQSTAFPMLTGTLITAAGFMPVGLAQSPAGEYTFGIFAVTGMALLISWIVAVLFAPYLGYTLLRVPSAQDIHHDIYDRGFYKKFAEIVSWCVTHRRKVITATVLTFVLSLLAFKWVPQQFFPNSTRPELVAQLWLPEGASHQATEALTRRLEDKLKGDARIDNFVAYLGGGSPRFVLVLDQSMPNTNLVEFVILAKSLRDRETLLADLNRWFDSDFSDVRARAARLPNGPPVGYPIQFRVSGPDTQLLRTYAEEVAAVMRAHPHTESVNFNWYTMSKIVRVEVDQNKARTLGVSTQQISFALRASLSGVPITQFREQDQLIDIVGRAADLDRHDLSRLRDLNIHIGNGRFVPLSQIAHIHYDAEDGLIWRRNRVPTITVRADIPDQVQAPDVSRAIDPLLDSIRERLPAGYRIEMGGALEKSLESQSSINAGLPLTLIVIVSLLMLQLNSFSRMFLTLLTAPLGLIGVSLFLLIFQQPFGFVAMLGVIALFGMIIRNAVILVDQIEQDRVAGVPAWDAIVGSAVRRFRPIVLTALAAILAMIPLARSVFWGPMAVAIMGGLLVATVLTLLVLPAMYAAWFRVER